jgi:hypothetical protein
MDKIKIIIDQQYVGIDSGWSKRYMGISSELYKNYKLSIFLPGDVNALKAIFPAASFVDKIDFNPYKIIRSKKNSILSILSRMSQSVISRIH